MYKVTINFTTEENSETKKETFACFAFLKLKKVNNLKTIHYYFSDHPGYKLNDKELELYLKALTETEDFKPYINVEEIVKTKRWSFELSNPRLHFCILATLIRNVQENPQLVRFALWVKDKIDIPFLNILLLIPEFAINTNHYISNSITNNAGVLKRLRPFNSTIWNHEANLCSLKETRIFNGVFDFFNSGYDFEQSPITHPTYLELNELKEKWYLHLAQERKPNDL